MQYPVYVSCCERLSDAIRIAALGLSVRWWHWIKIQILGKTLYLTRWYRNVVIVSTYMTSAQVVFARLPSDVMGRSRVELVLVRSCKIRCCLHTVGLVPRAAWLSTLAAFLAFRASSEGIIAPWISRKSEAHKQCDTGFGRKDIVVLLGIVVGYWSSLQTHQHFLTCLQIWKQVPKCFLGWRIKPYQFQTWGKE